MAHKPNIIITGAAGFVGNELVRHFSEHGWQVRALVRNPAIQPKVKNTIYHAYDMRQPVSETVFKDADYLVHAAFIKDGPTQPHIIKENRKASQQLLRLSRKYGLRRTVFLSSMSAHERAVSTYGKQKLAVEKLFTTPQDTILRCGLILGDGGLTKNIVSFMRTKHIAPYLGSGGQPLQVIARYDLARVVHAVLENDQGGLLYIAHPDVYSYREFYQLIIDELHLRAWAIPVPFLLPLLAIRTARSLHLPLKVTEDNLQGLKYLRAFETVNDLRKLGVQVDNLYEILHNPKIGTL